MNLDNRDSLIAQLESWMPLGRPRRAVGKGDGACFYMIDNPDDDDSRGTIKFWTEKHEYTLTVKTRALSEDRPSYLGCVASLRAPRPGEDWTRGNDLPDGLFCRETFDRIMRGVVAYEMLEVDVCKSLDAGKGIPVGPRDPGDEQAPAKEAPQEVG